MKGVWKELSKGKRLFKTSYCLDCQQVKSCGKLNWEYCCQCSYQNQLEKWADYLTYERALAYERQHQREHQRELLRLAKGEKLEDRLDFADWKKFYRQKSWGIKLEEWLRSERVLPVDIQCAEQWREDKEHLPEKCGCLERKAKELHEYFTECLERDKEKLKKECFCEANPKVRTPYVDSEGGGWTYCERCEKRIGSAGHHGVIKNRNDPRFWGLSIKEKVLCGGCLESEKERMPAVRRAEFNRYRKLGRFS